MSAPSLDDIARQLESQRSQTEAKESEMQNALSAIKEQLARLDGAIAALRGTPLAGLNGKSPKKSHDKRKVAAPAATREQVADLMAMTLRQHKLIKEEDLKALVERQLTDAGFSRMGYALRFIEAKADARFFSTEQGVTLRPRTTVSASPEVGQVADDVTPQVKTHRHPEQMLHT